MISSMTGYGRADTQNEQLMLTIEIRTLNSRFLDFAPRLPKVLVPFEDDAYKLVKEKCVRGRVTLSAKLEFLPGSNHGLVLNQYKLEEYLSVVQEIQKTVNQKDLPSMGDILRLPDILSSEDFKEEGELKQVFMDTLKKALEKMNKIRLDEGKNIQKDLSNRLNILDEISGKIRTVMEASRNETMEFYKQKIQDIVEDIKIDEARLIQEAAILSEKKDITEELVRLSSHIELFKKNMVSKKNEGKKLNFLLQEMNREINTIGSKTDSIEISHWGVDLKDELEKIREQVQNII